MICDNISIIYVVTYGIESCRTYECVVAHVWMSHGIYMNEGLGCRIYLEALHIQDSMHVYTLTHEWGFRVYDISWSAAHSRLSCHIIYISLMKHYTYISLMKHCTYTQIYLWWSTAHIYIYHVSSCIENVYTCLSLDTLYIECRHA